MSKARQFAESFWNDDDSGEDWKRDDDAEKPVYQTDYTKNPQKGPKHELDSDEIYGQHTDAELVDQLVETAERLAGFVDRGEVPNDKIRLAVITALTHLEDALVTAENE
jgi:hypothetical protein